LRNLDPLPAFAAVAAAAAVRSTVLVTARLLSRDVRSDVEFLRNYKVDMADVMHINVYSKLALYFSAFKGFRADIYILLEPDAGF
jgi:hypothetical protein